jgi:hypothetical protein
LQVVGFLPTLLAIGCLALLIKVGAPGQPLTLEALVSAARALGLQGALAITATAVAVAVTLQPLQFRLVQLMEGYWPTGHGGWVFKAGVGFQRWRLKRLNARLVTAALPSSQSGRRVIEERMADAEMRIRTRFPAADRLLPTALGNVLRSAEDRVGLRYGVDSVTLWPRLFPLLPADYRQSLEDEVTQLDVSCRLAVTWAATAIISLCILMRDASELAANWSWLLVVAGLLGLAYLSYKAAIESALAHGSDLEVALDLHRGLVIEAMRLPAPARLGEERRSFRWLCALLNTYDSNHGYDFIFRTAEAPTPPRERASSART